MHNSSHPNTALRINVTVTNCETVNAEINTDNAGAWPLAQGHFSSRASHPRLTGWENTVPSPSPGRINNPNQHLGKAPINTSCARHLQTPPPPKKEYIIKKCCRGRDFSTVNQRVCVCGGGTQGGYEPSGCHSSLCLRSLFSLLPPAG